MSGRYDRRPRRHWDDPDKRHGMGQQIGNVRLIGFAAILVVSFVLLNRKDEPVPTPSNARIAVDTALAPTVTKLMPKARLRVGASDQLATDLRERVVVDLAVLTSDELGPLADDETCSDAQAIAQRGTTVYAACLVNANGSSRDLGTAGLSALTSIKGREALLDSGFEIPDVRPSTPPSTP